jgi:hypothetical protein
MPEVYGAIPVGSGAAFRPMTRMGMTCSWVGATHGAGAPEWVGTERDGSGPASRVGSCERIPRAERPERSETDFTPGLGRAERPQPDADMNGSRPDAAPPLLACRQNVVARIS